MVRVWRRVTTVVVCVAVTAAAAGAAPTDKTLGRIKGTIGFQSTADTTFHRIVGRELVPDDATAITQTNSAALLTLPDSSLVGIGQNTQVVVGAFNNAADGPGATITVQNGTLRFDIHRPQGGVANYRFVTSTSQLAVRGTVGLLSFLNGQETVACLSCASDSVVLTTTAGQTFSIVTGQVLTVSAAGAVTTGALTSTILGTFSAAQVSTATAIGPAAATAGIPGAITGAIAAPVVAGAAAAAAAAGLAASGAFSASPAPSARPTQITTPTPAPSGTPNAPLAPQTRVKTSATVAAPVAAPTPEPIKPAPPVRGIRP